MQQGRTFAAAWAVMASLALPGAFVKGAHAGDTALKPTYADNGLTDTNAMVVIDKNPLGLENETTLRLSVPNPLPGRQQVGVNLQTITGKVSDLGVSLKSTDISVMGAKFSVDAWGTLGAVEEDLGNLNLTLRGEMAMGKGTANLNLNTSLGALESGDLDKVGVSFGFDQPLEGGSAFSLAGSGNLGGEGKVEARFRINLHPDAPVAATPPEHTIGWKHGFDDMDADHTMLGFGR